MTEQTTVAARRSITVNATPERAFDVFTAGFSTWWPLESHHIGETMADRGDHRAALPAAAGSSATPTATSATGDS